MSHGLSTYEHSGITRSQALSPISGNSRLRSVSQSTSDGNADHADSSRIRCHVVCFKIQETKGTLMTVQAVRMPRGSSMPTALRIPSY